MPGLGVWLKGNTQTLGLSGGWRLCSLPQNGRGEKVEKVLLKSFKQR